MCIYTFLVYIFNIKTNINFNAKQINVIFLNISFIFIIISIDSGKVAEDSMKSMFTHVGNIIVEKKGNLEHAMEDAINIGAEDVEELEENDVKYFQVYYMYACIRM